MNTLDIKNGPVAVLKYPRQDKALLGYAKGVLAAMIANAYYPNAGPLLATFKKDIDEYDAAETNAATKTLGAVALRNARRKKVIEDLHHLRDHVQGEIEAKAQANPADAAAMILSAGMAVRKIGKHNKAPLQVRNLGPSGTVLILVRALGASVVYFFQYSTDQINWIDVPETFKASLTLHGLSPATVYYFRFRARTRTGAVDFSQIVSLMVV
jgi:hypothetical protein